MSWGVMGCNNTHPLVLISHSQLNLWLPIWLISHSLTHTSLKLSSYHIVIYMELISIACEALGGDNGVDPEEMRWG